MSAQAELSGMILTLKGERGARASVIRAEIERARSALNAVLMLAREE